MMEPYLFLSYKKATILKVKHKKNNIVIAGVDLAIHEEEIPGTRCACPRMTEENNTVIPVFFSSPLSFPYSFLLLCHSRAWHGNLKRDVRLKAGHDKLLPA